MALAQIVIARKDHAAPPVENITIEPTPAVLECRPLTWTTVIFDPPDLVIPVPRRSFVVTRPAPFRIVTPPGGSGGGEHAYFNGLVAGPYHERSFSLRSQTQLETESSQYQRYSDGTGDVNYVYPNDPDPRKQDAAKIWIRHDTLTATTKDVDTPIVNQNSIKQVRFRHPTMVPGQSYLTTWDIWFGDEWRAVNSGLTNHKMWQFDAPGWPNYQPGEPGYIAPGWPNNSPDIWWEPHTTYSNREVNAETDICHQNVRHYSGALRQTTANDGSSFAIGTWIGCPRGPNMTNNNPVQPYTAFVIKPETWTRLWTLFEYSVVFPCPWNWLLTDGGFGGTLVSMWAADENRNAVKIYDRMQVTLWRPAIRNFWIEVNTSTNEIKAGRGYMIAYMRNLVFLSGLEYDDVPSILQRPLP